MIKVSLNGFAAEESAAFINAILSAFPAAVQRDHSLEAEWAMRAGARLAVYSPTACSVCILCSAPEISCIGRVCGRVVFLLTDGKDAVRIPISDDVCLWASM